MPLNFTNIDSFIDNHREEMNEKWALEPLDVIILTDAKAIYGNKVIKIIKINMEKSLIVAYLIFVHFGRMMENHNNRIPINENNKLVGIVSRSDIIKAVAEFG